MNKPLLVFQKRADKTQHKIIIPSYAIENLGYNYYMEVFEDKIVLTPIENERGE